MLFSTHLSTAFALNAITCLHTYRRQPAERLHRAAHRPRRVAHGGVRVQVEYACLRAVQNFRRQPRHGHGRDGAVAAGARDALRRRRRLRGVVRVAGRIQVIRREVVARHEGVV